MSNILTIINQAGVILAYLNNLGSASIHKVINGEYVLNFVALIEPLKTEFLYDEDNLIEYDNDYFKVINLDDEHDDNNMLKVTVSCEHISYDLIKQTKPTYTQTNRSAIYVMNDLLTGTGFNFIGTDVTTTASIDIQKEADIKSLLYQVATIWQGEIKYFQKDIELKQSLGINRGTDFRFGKNLKYIRRSIDKVENTVSYEVEVVQGSELEELGFFDLGDTVRVVDDALNIEIDIRIIELERDLITGLNSSVTLGQPIKDLTTKLVNINKVVAATEKKVSSVIDEHGKLIASQLSGTLQTAVETVEGSKNGGMTYVPGVGIVLHNQPTQETSTEAMLLTANGLLISNSKSIDGSWNWRTAATGESISADAITTGELTAISINGVTITGSTIVSESATSKVTVDEGTVVIYDKVNDKNLFEAESGNLTVNGFLRTGYTENATYIDDNGIFFNDGTDWSSFIIGGMTLVLNSEVGIALVASSIYANGNFSVSGMKNCRIATEQFGDVDFSAYETAEIYLGDIGESEVINGECIINLDEKLLACVNTDMHYQVFLQAYGDGRVWVEQRNATNFVVKGDNTKFAWEVKAKRKNYENIRFGQQQSIN